MTDPLALAGGGTALLFGLVFGSFVTAASYRLPRGVSVVSGRSACPACGHGLTARDLVPLVSWLAARGRCRHCGAPVSWRYPLIELATGALFVLAWARADDPLQAVVLAGLVVGLMIMTVADLECGIIPDAVHVGLAPLALAWHWLGDWAPMDMAGGAVLGAGLGLGLRLGFRRIRGYDGLGLGDVKFLAVAGLWLGLGGLAPFLVLAGAAGLGLGLGWRLSGRGRVFPFGPALALALLAGVLFPGMSR